MTPRPASLPSLLSNSPRRRLVRLQLPLPCPAPTALDHGRIRSSRHEMDSNGVEWSGVHSLGPSNPISDNPTVQIQWILRISRIDRIRSNGVCL